MRVPQDVGERGSLKWLQRICEFRPSILNDAVRSAASRKQAWSVEWVSPRQDDGWAEYRDAKFLEVLGLDKLVPDLKRYWPSRGPQWDALGRSSDGGVVLVEAKAHISELRSTCAAGIVSLPLIKESLRATKHAFGVQEEADWLSPYYQYANRLAHLHFFHAHDVAAMLVFLYFTGDHDMGGPLSADGWKEELKAVCASLGVIGELRDRGVYNSFVDIQSIGVV